MHDFSPMAVSWSAWELACPAARAALQMPSSPEVAGAAERPQWVSLRTVRHVLFSLRRASRVAMAMNLSQATQEWTSISMGAPELQHLSQQLQSVC